MNWPTPLDGDTALHRWLNRLLMAAKASQPLTTADVKAGRGPDGSQLKVNFPPTPRPVLFHPFKIYQVAPYTFRIRGGYVACRPQRIDYRTAVSNGATYFNNDNEVRLELDRGGSDGGEFVLESGALNATRDYTRGPVIGSPPTAAIGITDETVTIGNTGDYTVADPANTAQWKLSEGLDSTSGPAAAFWIEYSDAGADGSIPILKIKARMITGDSPSANSRSDEWFPSTASTPFDQIVQIGYVVQSDGNIGTSPPDDPSRLTIVQLLNGHVTNHTPFGAFGVRHSPMYYRGTWGAGTHAGLVYYPGDCVTKSGGGLYIWTDYPAKTSTGPPGGSWTLIS